MARGRPTGAKNKKTLEREALEARARQIREEEAKAWVAEKTIAAVPTKKLGKEILDDFANLFAGLAAYYQPWPASAGVNPHEDIGKFNYYAEKAIQAAAAVAAYQSPRLSAVAVGAAVVNEVTVKGGMPDDFAPPAKGAQVIEFKPGTVVTPQDFDRKDEAASG